MRIPSLDLARGYTVLCIPAVHTLLLYSQPAVRDTLAGEWLKFIAEGPGAPLFMTYMGIALPFTRSLSGPVIFRRSAVLLGAAYALNIAKFVLPLQWGGLPKTFQADLGVTDPCTAGETVFLIGDILHFAALALPITYAVFRLRKYWWYAITIAAFVAMSAPAFWDLHVCSPVINYVIRLIGGQPPSVYFPLFPWLTYPLAGLAIGAWLQRNPPDRFLFIGLVGIALIITGQFISYFDAPSGTFYRTRVGDTAIHLGIVCVSLWVWEIIATYVKPNAVFRLLQYASRYITLIYLIQWPLICWCVPFFGYQQLSYIPSLVTAVGMTSLTLLCSLLIQASTREGVTLDN